MLSLALRQPDPSLVRVLCDELAARKAADALGLEVMGSIGLILQAYRDGAIDKDTARRSLSALPHQGRLHISPRLLHAAIQSLES